MATAVASRSLDRIKRLFRLASPLKRRKTRVGSFGDDGAEEEGDAMDAQHYGTRRPSGSVDVSPTSSVHGSDCGAFNAGESSWHGSEFSAATAEDTADAPTARYKPPDRVRFADDLVAYAPDGGGGPLPKDLWWSRAERTAQFREQQAIVSVELARRSSNLPCPPIPNESRRGLGIACEPSTPLRRAERIAWARRDIIETSLEASPEALAHFAAALASDAVRAAVAVALNDRVAAYPDLDVSECATPPQTAPRTISAESVPGALQNSMIRCDSLDALNC